VSGAFNLQIRNDVCMQMVNSCNVDISVCSYSGCHCPWS